MKFTESMLEGYAMPLSATEDQQCKNAIRISNVKVGTYAIQKHKIKADKVTAMVIQTALKTEDKGYCSFGELTDFCVMFPFEYSVSREQLLEDNRFIITNFGGELNIGLRNEGRS